MKDQTHTNGVTEYPTVKRRSSSPCSEVVYRVQDKDGRGPWKPGFSAVWCEDREDHENLLPWYSEFGAVHEKAIYGMTVGSACRTLKQLRRWFTESEYKTLKKHGYRCVKLQVGRVIAESEIQLFVERSRAFNRGAKTINLYPQNEIGQPSADKKPNKLN